jgi:general stress protein YciG
MKRSESESPPRPKQRRGFATIDPDKLRAISSKGGKTAHEQGRAHEFSSDEAREAGRQGGLVASRDREHMAEIGRKGGKSRRRLLAAKKSAEKDPSVD